MVRLTRLSLLSLPGSWSGPHRLWARRIPGEPGKFRTLAQVRARLGDDCKLLTLLAPRLRIILCSVHRDSRMPIHE